MTEGPFEALKRFVMTNQLIEHDLDLVESKYGVDLQRDHQRAIEPDEAYYPQIVQKIHAEASRTSAWIAPLRTRRLTRSCSDIGVVFAVIAATRSCRPEIAAARGLAACRAAGPTTTGPATWQALSSITGPLRTEGTLLGGW